VPSGGAVSRGTLFEEGDAVARENGLRRFTLHRDDPQQEYAVAAVAEETADRGRALAAFADPGRLDPETAARRYLDGMISSPAVPALAAAGENEAGPEYRTIGTETVPLTGTTVVKFAQYHGRIPVYGSLVTIELDDDNALLAASSALGDPADVDPVATVSPARAREVVHEHGGVPSLRDVPRQYFYHDDQADPPRWRLVYIARDVPREAADDTADDTADGAYAAPDGVPQLADFVVDAHSGELVAVLPRTQTATWTAAEDAAEDGLGERRSLRVQRNEAGNRRLNDTVRNVRTHDFAFRDAAVHQALLPGDFVVNPPDPWDGGAVSAHANAAEVAEFLTTVLRREGLDGRGGPFVSTVNCMYLNAVPGDREWRNAAWVGTQMIYGQRMVGGILQSYAIAKDVVAHEIMHGLTDKTARLEYQRESGALNESYSDIFGIVISNTGEPDTALWNWEMGEDLDRTGIPLRDLSDPPKRGQPDHMDDFRPLPPTAVPTPRNDYGWVHVNSGIHNKAAFNLLTARNADGSPTVTPAEGVALFYLAVSQFLSRTSTFADSRLGVSLAARTLFRREPAADRDRRLAAIDRAFSDVGIGLPV
jgi:Zn-dependent metalloprotease